jgi:hypothetical protein
MYCPSYLYIPASSEAFPLFLLHPTLPVMAQSIIPLNPTFLHLLSLFLPISYTLLYLYRHNILVLLSYSPITSPEAFPPYILHPTLPVMAQYIGPPSL